MSILGNRYATEEDIQKMKDLRAKGLSTRQIMKETGFTNKTVIKYTGISDSGKAKRMSEEDIQKMNELRDQGLSNSQIAIELGVTHQTIVRHIGAQKKGARAAYGSIVAHADGEHFAHNPMPGFEPLSKRMEKEEAAAVTGTDETPKWLEDTMKKQAEKKEKTAKSADLLTVKSVITYAGQKLIYKVNSEGTILITEEGYPGSGIQLSFKEFNIMLEELMQLIDKIPQK